LGTPTQVDAVKIFTETMKQRLNHNEEIIDHIIPDFPVGCRRNTPGPGFLEALVKENVTVITTPIEMITPKGLRLTDGREIACDVLVCATGFDATFRPRFPLIGRGERSLSEEWTANSPDAYLGVAVSGYPNYFSIRSPKFLLTIAFMGPNTPVANGTLLGSVQAQGDYMSKVRSLLRSADGR
jgi:cation diffusion facilitator CzcD-associated flavoprotein CzcO